MRSTRFALFGSILLLGSGLQAQAPTPSKDLTLLNLPLSSDPLVRNRIPLTEALSEVGVQVREGYVLFGIEVHLKEDKEPTVSMNLPADSTLGEALREILAQLPNYKYEIAGTRLINIYPEGAKTNPENVLNIRVQRFDVVNEPPATLLSTPQLFIAELNKRLTVPPRAGEPTGSIGPTMRPVGGTRVTLRLRNVTVRGILNSVSEETAQAPSEFRPLGWVYSFQPNPASPVGGTHAWTFHWSVPSNWKR